MPDSLPTTLFYGEDAGLAAADVMHAESIAERSGLHSWEIRPHRHEALLQVFHIEAGRVELVLDDARRALAGPGVILVMPLAMHGFRWTSDVRGTVFTILEPHLRRLLAPEPALRDALLRSRAERLPAGERRPVQDAVAALAAEVARHEPWRASAIDAGLTRLAIALARALPGEAPQPAAGDRSLQHVQRFRALVDERFREQPPLAEFAAALGITTTQLNRVCRAVVGHPALAVLHARLCLEAQRELAYTTLSIKHIAFRLGFGDAGYFTRFFQRETGTTPSAWRAALLDKR